MGRFDSMEESPLLSVVIPVFNDAVGLRKTLTALDDLPASSRSQLEVIVKDGGSSDGFLEAVAAFMHMLAHVESSQDRGIYDAMNAGVARARGRWVWFLGAGDLPDPKGLAAMLSLAREHAQAREHGQAKEHPRGLGPQTDIAMAACVHALPPLEPGVPSAFIPRWDWRLMWRNTMHHQGLWIPRLWLVERPFDTSYRVLADYAWILQLRKSQATVACHPHVVLARVQADGLSRQFTPSLYLEEWRIKKQQLPWVWMMAQAFWLPLKWAFKLSSKTLKSLGSSTPQ
jgi:putative colanic acid biosynthesis glycosyltransferase